jgi:hypothetical protein
LKLLSQCANCIGGGVHLVVEREQSSLFGEEEEYQSHEDRDGARVDLRHLELLQQCSPTVEVRAAYRGDQHFGGAANLAAQLISNDLLRRRRLS